MSVVATPRGAPGQQTPPPLPLRRAPRPRTDVLLVAADGAAALAGVAAAAVPGPAAAALVAGVLALHAYAGLYRPHSIVAGGVLDEVPALAFRAAVAWCVLAAVLAALRPDLALGSGALAGACAAQLGASCCGRAAVYGVRRRRAARAPRSALVVGPPGAALRVTAALARRPLGGIRPVGVVVPVTAQPPDGAGVPVLRTIEEVQRAIIQNSVRDVLFTDADAADHSVLLSQLGAWGCTLWYVDTRAPVVAAGGRGGELAAFPVRRVQMTDVARPGFVVKRLLDLAVAVTALLLAAPVLLVCAALLRWSDGPGVVFRQERVGRDGHTFTLLKFRTLRPADAHEAATRWSVADDERMSRTGRIMRLTSLDELLNLWNVVRGDMSLVGPRPERPYFVAQFGQAHRGYLARHRMPVGITGLAQVQGLRGDTSIEDRARYDNYYIDHWSPWQDVCVLVRTAASLARPTGS
ncbi:exopolysaccharide biosynthesis polyprenyl glycosylphosphotransferase [Streptomyces sp. NPDC020719]|uniref:exopolysaccharide biosynthesis polyprenyl glycosylphosphotransferase n=1 Tax=Streptomyces sp. NPDC020719 TaxID=3154896 RepID=UPI0033D106F9